VDGTIRGLGKGISRSPGVHMQPCKRNNCDTAQHFTPRFLLPILVHIKFPSPPIAYLIPEISAPIRPVLSNENMGEKRGRGNMFSLGHNFYRTYPTSILTRFSANSSCAQIDISVQCTTCSVRVKRKWVREYVCMSISKYG
jgi:hypothetical protein